MGKTQKQTQFRIAAIVLGTLLLLSVAVGGLTQNSFASHKSKQTVSTKTTIQHVINGDSISIDSLTLYVKVAKKTVNKTLTFEIIEGSSVKGSEQLDLNGIKGAYKPVSVQFDPAVEVDGNFDIKIQGEKGIALRTVKDTRDKNPGFLEINGKNYPKKDLRFLINDETIVAAVSNGGSNNENNNNENNNSGQTSNNTGGTNTGTGTTAKLLVNAKDQNSDLITGLWIVVLQGTKVIDTGDTEELFTLTKGEYAVYMDDYTNGVTTWTFVGWEDSAQGKLRTANLTGDETFTALYNVQDGTSSSGGDNSGTEDGSTGSGTGGDGSNTAGGANTVSISTQLLDGSVVTGLEAQLREADTGVNVDFGFTPTVLQMEEGKDYRAIMYSFSPYWFRHWTDGGLHRYELVSGDGEAHSLTAVYEHIPADKEAQLTVKAKTSDGTPIGGTTGTQEDNTLQAQPGIEVLVSPPGSLIPYTAGFTGGSEASPFHLVKGQTYTILIEEFGQYQFSHWEDDGSTNRLRQVPMNSNSITLTAVYNVV